MKSPFHRSGRWVWDGDGKDIAEVKSAEDGDEIVMLLNAASKAMKLLQQAADGLYNGFEPDNQSALWLRINAFLKSEGAVDRTGA